MRALVKTDKKGLYRDATDPYGDLVWARRGDEVYDTLDEAQQALVILAKVHSTHKQVDIEEAERARERKRKGKVRANALVQAAKTVEPIKIDLRPKAEPRELPRTVSDTGKVLVGQVIVIQCDWDGCIETRTIKPQDAFQVKYCVRHQEQNRRNIRAARARLKRAEQKAQLDAELEAAISEAD